MKAFWTTLLIAAVPQALRACPVCFQIEPGPTADGLLAAVGVLVGVTICVLAGVAYFVAGFVRRS